MTKHIGQLESYFKYDDGGRAAAGYKGRAGDCAARAIAIAAQLSYEEAYRLVNKYCETARITKRKPKKTSARTGVYKDTAKKIFEALGWKWQPTMFIGKGCTVHLKKQELPMGRLVCCLSKHYTAVIDGVIHDTYDPSRAGTRCVYGYYYKPE